MKEEEKKLVHHLPEKRKREIIEKCVIEMCFADDRVVE
jgi:hypothetical protein